MVSVEKGILREDIKGIEKILRSTGFFYDFEIEIALGLALDSAGIGSEESGYCWMKIKNDDRILGFANYVKNSFSVHSWELYWIAMDQNFRNMKLGSTLLNAVEEDIRNAGGRMLWLDTSGRPLYAPTESFYRRNGYTLAASLPDFYAPGDPKQVYYKTL
jgi:ribosomal protein S18 acetylase RimI-like enzyme